GPTTVETCVVRTNTRRRQPLAIVCGRAKLHCYARRTADRPHDAEEGLWPIDAAVEAKARCKIDDLECSPALITQDCTQNGRVAQIGLLRFCRIDTAY